jgi:hypothetical protein
MKGKKRIKNNRMETKMNEFRRKIEFKAPQLGLKVEPFIGFQVKNANGDVIYLQTLIEVDDYLNKNGSPVVEMEKTNPFLANIEVNA